MIYDDMWQGSPMGSVKTPIIAYFNSTRYLNWICYAIAALPSGIWHAQAYECNQLNAAYFLTVILWQDIDSISWTKETTARSHRLL